MVKHLNSFRPDSAWPTYGVDEAKDKVVRCDHGPGDDDFCSSAIGHRGTWPVDATCIYPFEEAKDGVIARDKSVIGPARIVENVKLPSLLTAQIRRSSRSGHRRFVQRQPSLSPYHLALYQIFDIPDSTTFSFSIH